MTSRSSQVGDPFTASVIRDVVVDGRGDASAGDQQLIIPAGSRVEGHVTAVDRAERMSRAGTIAVTFDRLVLPGGQSVPVEGSLASIDGEPKENPEDFADEDRIEGGGQRRRAIIFIGAGAGAGAVIGATTKGGKGAAVGAGIGAAIGMVGVLLSKGEEAEVNPGTEFGMRVERTFTLDTEALGITHNSAVPDQRHYEDRYYEDGRTSYDPQYETVSGDLSSQAALDSTEAIRAAQISLKERGYYTGPINGQMRRATRRALRQFQMDNGLTVSGTLDIRTARELGIPKTQNQP